MPLKNPTYTSALGARDTASTQVQDEHSRNELLSRSSTPPHTANEFRSRRSSNTSHDNEASNPLGAKDIGDKHKALAMKMALPNAGSSRPTNASKKAALRNTDVDHEVDLGLHGAGTEYRTNSRTKSAFDDTSSINFDVESLLADNDNHTIVFRGNPAPSHRHLLQPINYKRQYAHDSVFGDSEDRAQTTEQQLQEQQDSDHLDINKKLIRKLSVKNDTDTRVGQQSRNRADTPSRPLQGSLLRNVRNGASAKMVSFDSPAAKSRGTVRLDSPELEIPRDKMTTKPASDSHSSGLEKIDLGIAKSSLLDSTSLEGSLEKTLPDQQMIAQDTRHSSVKHPFEPSRTVDYPTSSEDEIPLVQSRTASHNEGVRKEGNFRKRHQEQHIDYDMRTLKAMKFSDLDKEDFGKDPRDGQRNSTFDPLGNPMALLQRLGNLSKMSEEEQKAMFRNQDDKEWEQMGSWFIDRFQEGLKKLMDVRLERRKISLKFENEIRERQKEIDWCANGVEEELRGLRKGGDELIKGRDLPSRRSTPQKK